MTTYDKAGVQSLGGKGGLSEKYEEHQTIDVEWETKGFVNAEGYVQFEYRIAVPATILDWPHGRGTSYIVNDFSRQWEKFLSTLREAKS